MENIKRVIKTKQEKLYICTGANFKNGYGAEYCGDIHPLNEWIELLWNDQAKTFFEGDNEKYIIKYIYENTGKRLERL